MDSALGKEKKNVRNNICNMFIIRKETYGGIDWHDSCTTVDYVKPDDVKKIAESVLLHRLVLTSEAKIAKEDAAGILSSLVLKARIPV